MTETFPEDEVFDLDAVAAEARQAPLRFKLGGQEWTLEHFGNIDWRVTSAASMGDVEAIRTAFRYGMGDEQTVRFEEVTQPVSAMTALFSRWMKHGGMSQGESSASTESSDSTEKQSRPASAPTTPESTSASSSPVSSPPANSPSSSSTFHPGRPLASPSTVMPPVGVSAST